MCQCPTAVIISILNIDITTAGTVPFHVLCHLNLIVLYGRRYDYNHSTLQMRK